MNSKLRVFFEFRLPLISYFLLFICILVLYFFNVKIPPLGIHQSQIGILILFFGFGIRVLASSTLKYLGKIKITGVYALCRHPMLLGQLLSFLGLNLMVGNIYFLSFSILVFICNELIPCRKYEKILSHHYREIWQIYKKHTHFLLPFCKRMKDFLTPSLSTNELENSHNFPIFLLIYIIMVEIATLSNMS